MEGIKASTTGSFVVDLHRYEVPDLIVEDYEEAMGFKLEIDKTEWIAKPSIMSGRFLIKVGSEVRLIESENLYLTFTEFYANAVTDSLVTDANRELIQVIWNEYQQKG
jgi:hypothetical protein